LSPIEPQWAGAVWRVVPVASPGEPGITQRPTPSRHCDGRWLWSNSRYLCVDRCPSGFHVNPAGTICVENNPCRIGYHQQGGTCVKSCSPLYALGNTCVETCPAGSHPERGVCQLTRCPSGYRREGGTCAKICASGYHALGDTCVKTGKTCTSGYRLVGNT